MSSRFFFLLILAQLGASAFAAERLCLQRPQSDCTFVIFCGPPRDHESIISALAKNIDLRKNIDDVFGDGFSDRLTKIPDIARKLQPGEKPQSLIFKTAGQKRDCSDPLRYVASPRKGDPCDKLVSFTGRFEIDSNSMGEMGVQIRGLYDTPDSKDVTDRLVYVEELCSDGNSVEMKLGNDGLHSRSRAVGGEVNTEIAYFRKGQLNFTSESTVAGFLVPRWEARPPVAPDSDPDQMAKAQGTATK